MTIKTKVMNNSYRVNNYKISLNRKEPNKVKRILSVSEQ